MIRVRPPFPSPFNPPTPSLPSSLNLLPVSSLFLPGAAPEDSRFRSEAVCRSTSRLFRLPGGGADGGGSSGNGAWQSGQAGPLGSPAGGGQAEARGPRAMNYNAKDEVDGGPPCPPGGPAKTRRPDNTAFKQQRLPAWQPILTAGTVLPTFFIIGLIFIPIGIGIFVTSNNIREIEVREGRGGVVPWLPEGDRRAPPSGAISDSSAGFLSLQFWRLGSFCFRSAWLGTERMSGGQDLFIG